MAEKEVTGVRYRCNLSTTSKGLPSWDVTCEFADEVPSRTLREEMMESVLEDVETLAKELSRRYPEGEPL